MRRTATATGIAFIAAVLGFVLVVFAGAEAPRVTAQASPAASPAADCPTSTPEENEALARRHVEIRFDESQLDAYDDLVSPDYIHHRTLTSDVWRGPEAYKESLRRVQAGFDASGTTIEAIFGDGEYVGVAWSTQLTHTGEFLGAPPSGRTALWEAMNIFRFECGRIAETWSTADNAGFYRQIGMITDAELATVATPTP